MAKKQTPQQIISQIRGILGEYSSQSGGRTLSNQDKKILEKGLTSRGGRTLSNQDKKILEKGIKTGNTNMSQPRAKGGAIKKMAKGGTAKKKK